MGYTDVSPQLLDTPAHRLATLAGDIGTMDNEVGVQASAAGAAAGHPEVTSGCATFKAGVSGGLMTFGTDAGLLSDTIAKAKVAYTVTDQNAFTVSALESD